jgi:ankyrin repeat protein
MLKRLVAVGIPVTARELCLAGYTGNSESLGVLLKLYKGDAAGYVTGTGDWEAGPGRTLLQVTCDGLCGLRRNVAESYTKCVAMLLKIGVPVDAIDRKGRTCLQRLISDRDFHDLGFENSPQHMALLSLLLDHGASTTALDDAGHSAVTLAKQYGLARVEDLFTLWGKAGARSKL